MGSKLNNQKIQKICDLFGEDLDSQFCHEVAQIMDECPECRVFYDSIKRSVKWFRLAEEEEDVPRDVRERLFKVLHLEDFQSSGKRKENRP